jgi:hypothetical protein
MSLPQPAITAKKARFERTVIFSAYLVSISFVITMIYRARDCPSVYSSYLYAGVLFKDSFHTEYFPFRLQLDLSMAIKKAS